MVGVAGEGEVADATAERLVAAGHRVERGEGKALAGAGPVVAVGTAALATLVDADVESPVVPVATDPEVPAVRLDDVPAVVEALTGDGGAVETRRLPLLAAAADGERVGRAVLDVMLVRSEPGHISEYGVTTTGPTTRFRADGVVVATPAGSHGYAAAAGGPRLDAGVDAVAVVPVAPFALGADALVVDPADGLAVAVERDEGAVSLLLDGREQRTLAGGSSVTLSVDGHLSVVRPAAR